MTIHQDPTAPMFRRAKPVISRDVSAAKPEHELLPAVVPSAPPPAPSGLIRPTDGDVPVLDPTRYSLRRRKHSHVLRYRLAELATGLSFLTTIAAITCLALGDRFLGQLATALAVLLGLLAIWISWPTRLSSRVLGYAISATLIGVLGAAVALSLPASWFDDPSPEKAEQLEPVRPRRPQ